MPKMDEYYYLSNKRYRALIVNFETLSSYGEGSALYCLTDFQAAWLLSMTEYMRWKNRWDNCPCTEEDLDAMAAELEFNLMNCFDTSWLGQSQYIFDQIQNEQLADLNARYDLGGLPEVNPNTPTDFYTGDSSPDRVNALCFACDTYVRTIINAWAENLRRSQPVLDFSAFAVSFVPYVGRIAAVVIKALSIAVQTAVNAANDQTAIDDVICCMYNSLNGAAVNQANFVNSLDLCGFDVGSNAAILRDIIAADIDNFSNWLTFMDTLGKCYVYLQAGVDYSCPCITPATWVHGFDFTIDDGGWTQYLVSVTGGTNGVYVPATGWQASDTAFAGSGLWRRTANIHIGFDTRTITRVVVVYDLTKGTYNPSGTAIAILDDNVVIKSDLNSVLVDGTDLIYDTGDISRVSSDLRFYIASSIRNIVNYSGYALIKSITVYGEGTDPF